MNVQILTILEKNVKTIQNVWFWAFICSFYSILSVFFVNPLGRLNAHTPRLSPFPRFSCICRRAIK